ncbi:MAG: DUF4058 family protein [Anaerolineae bacterium]|nr:DUF4058 family protein [Anaerolineae bacterium]
MPSPFPGMDPYLENPAWWRDFHNRFAAHIARQLQPLLRPRYVAHFEPQIEIGVIDVSDAGGERVVPDVAVMETQSTPVSYAATQTVAPAPLRIAAEVWDVEEMKHVAVHIKHVPDLRLVTVIEMLSPINKRPGNEAFEAYRRKRARLVQSRVHLLELDLLRSGRRVPAAEPFPDVPYLVILSRAGQRAHYEVWPITLQSALPTVPVPLLPPDADAPLRLASVFDDVYEEGAYDLLIDYAQPPDLPLRADWAAWADEHLRSQGVRA